MAMRFLPGIYVFPGGRVERTDSGIELAHGLPAHVQRKLTNGAPRLSPQRAQALAAAAIRETAEETGLFLGARGEWKRRRIPQSWSAFAGESVVPDLSGLALIARAVTPTGLPRRYDTRFFAADAESVAVRGELPSGPDAELDDLRWLTREETDELDLLPITRVILEELFRRIEAGISRDLPVPFFRFRAGRMRRDEI
jgi:8-oxo-dGTP pyrophosphatase MutT (NUDIX family)